MIPLERKSKIIELLKKEKFMNVKEIADRIYVSPMTVRRDLRTLEDEGLIRRKWGGAEAIEMTVDSNSCFSYVFRRSVNSKAKKDIAYEAFLRISSGDTVYIDSSSTATYITEFLTPDMNVTVVTNSLQAANMLAEKGISSYLIGGGYNDLSMAFFGNAAEVFADSFHIDKMFFSSQGIVPGEYIYDPNEQDTKMRQLFIERSEKTYFLCDSAKIGKKFIFRVCKTSDVDEIISDAKPTPEVSA